MLAGWERAVGFRFSTSRPVIRLHLRRASIPVRSSIPKWGSRPRAVILERFAAGGSKVRTLGPTSGRMALWKGGGSLAGLRTGAERTVSSSHVAGAARTTANWRGYDRTAAIAPFIAVDREGDPRRIEQWLR